MEQFNNMLSAVLNGRSAEQDTIDTDDSVGVFGDIDSDGVAPSEEKLVLRLEGGIEIHIPNAVYNQMAEAMGGSSEIEDAQPLEDGESTALDAIEPVEDDGEDNDDGDSNATDNPFKKKEDSDEDSDKDSDDDTDEDKEDKNKKKEDD